jgi:hypothetical protein
MACDPRARLAQPDNPRLAITERWITDQATYFKSSAGRDTWNRQRLKRLAFLLFWTGLAAGPLATLVPTLNGIVNIGIAAQFMAGTLAAFAATLALDEHAQSYGRMREIFTRANALAGESMDLAVLARELGREALAENATWLTLHRSRPPSFGKTGNVVKVTKIFEGAAHRLLAKEKGRLSR